ncbi:hypothetical protein M0802_000315 [Mischocyttarus mexicanus]|nr:hypothetical protein M0802_000315 [Mischocyttarus mexicanus]
MALSLALPLSGIEAEYFYALGAQVLYDNGLRSINGIGPYSPSTESESSSGFSSLTPSIESNENVGSDQTDTPSSSRPQSPVIFQDDSRITKINQENDQLFSSNSEVQIRYNNRDILNLGANIRDPVWMLMRCPSKLSNPSLDKKRIESLPEYCDDCTFCTSIYTTSIN